MGRNAQDKLRSGVEMHKINLQQAVILESGFQNI